MTASLCDDHYELASRFGSIAPETALVSSTGEIAFLADSMNSLKNSRLPH